MKVTEIIAQEGVLAGLTQAGRRMLGTVKGEVVDKAVSILSGRGRLAGAVTEKEAERVVNSLGPVAKEELKKDPKILKYIIDKANEVRAPTVLGRAASAVSWAGTKKAFSTLTNGYIIYSFGSSGVEAVMTYRDNVEAAEANWKSGKWTEENYNYVRQHEMSIMIAKLAASLPARYVVSGVLGGLSKLPLVGWLPAFLKTLDKAVLVGYLTVLNSDWGRETIAKLAVLSWLELPVIGPLLESLGVRGDMSDVIGATGVSLIDKLKSAANKETSATAAPGAQTQKTDVPTQPGQQAQPAAGQSAKPAATTTPAKSTETPRNKWIDLGGGMIKDPVTGHVDYK